MDKVADELINMYNEAANEAEFYRKIFLERSQLYGIVIELFKRYNLKSLTVYGEEMKEANKSLILFTPIEDGKSLRIDLLDNDLGD